MEALIAVMIGALTAGGVYLLLQRRSFPVILGLSLLSYAVNIFIFISGRVALNAPPIIGMGTAPTDPLPQALVLTAIVISFGMTAVLLMLALGSFLHKGDDSGDGGMP
jgi:multicomponent K+:H+ antiporter subunit C